MSPRARRTQPDDSWKQRAACVGMDPELFFPQVSPEGAIPPTTKKQINHVLAVCFDCPVRAECREYARYFDDRNGIWGGVLLNRRGRPQTRLSVVS